MTRKLYLESTSELATLRLLVDDTNGDFIVQLAKPDGEIIDTLFLDRRMASEAFMLTTIRWMVNWLPTDKRG